MILEFKDVKFSYKTKKERDIDLKRIKNVLVEHETSNVLEDEQAEEEVYSERDDVDDIDADEMIEE